MYDIVGEGLSKKIYKDLAEGSVKEIGKTCEAWVHLVATLIRAPAIILGNRLEEALDKFTKKIKDEATKIPSEDRIELTLGSLCRVRSELPLILGEPELEDLFLNLLVSSMDKRAAGNCLPCFPAILSSISPDEAKILKFLASHQSQSVFAQVSIFTILPNGTLSLKFRNGSMLGIDSGCQYPKNSPTYLDNLARLGLIEMSDEMILDAESEYQRIMDNYNLVHSPDNNPGPMNYDPKYFEVVKGFLRLSELGITFCRACKILREPQGVYVYPPSSLRRSPVILRNLKKKKPDSFL